MNRRDRKRSLRTGETPRVADNLSAPSPLVRRFGPKLVEAANGRPILDVGCGTGRNGIYLANLGGSVICLDRNTDLLRQLPRSRRIVPLHMDLVEDRWPFVRGQFGGIVSVHCLMPALFQRFMESLSPGGCLLIETVPGHGGNFMELPTERELSRAFAKSVRLEFYQEKKAGPVGCGKVTVRLFGTRGASRAARVC